MAKDDDTTPPALKTAFEATDHSVLPLDKAVLLGTFIRGDASEALVRTASGGIHKVARGDHLGYAVVTAIEPGILHLAEGGMARRLKIPGPAPDAPPRVRPHARPERDAE